MPGYHGRILEIDLTRGTAVALPLDEALGREWLGGRGLAARLFCDRVDPGCDPLGPDNALVLAGSPLLGTTAPTACRGHMVFKSPLTGGMGSSNCGGTWAPTFKAAGYDALVIRGRSERPVWIDIDDGGAVIRPADDLWGLDVPAVTDRLSAGAGPGKRPRVLCIGPAGENRVRFAAVMNDLNRAYGRGGPGAVLGSKRLKAVRVSAGGRTLPADPDRFRTGREQALYIMQAAPITKRLLRELGTLGLLRLIEVMEMLPARNFNGNRHPPEGIERISGETMARTLLRRAKACWGCPIGCQRHTQTGGTSGEGPEYETTVMLGPLCGIYDLEAIARAGYRCNELGIDTISMGGTLACAMELFESGALAEHETEDKPLRFGDAGQLEKMVEAVAERRGIGDRMAEGALRLAESTGHPEAAMTVKGQEIPAYDPRGSFAQALGYATSPTGACHLRGGYAVSLAFFGGAREIPRFSRLQSPIAARNQQNHGIIQDCLGVCRFTGFAFGPEPWSRMLSGMTGEEISTARLEETADRIAALERSFNLAAGWKAGDDILPERFLRSTIEIGGKPRRIPRAALIRMREDYYEARGWSRKGGIPSRRPQEEEEDRP